MDTEFNNAQSFSENLTPTYLFNNVYPNRKIGIAFNGEGLLSLVNKHAIYILKPDALYEVVQDRRDYTWVWVTQSGKAAEVSKGKAQTIAEKLERGETVTNL